MNCVSFATAEAFRARAGGFLERHEAENTVLIGALLSLAREARQDAVMRTVEHDGAVVLAAAMTPPLNLILSLGNLDAPDSLVDALVDSDLALPGVFGPASLAEGFAAGWQRRTGCPALPGLKVTLHRLTEVSAPTATPGELGPARDTDAGWLADWARDFSVEVGLDQREVYSRQTVATRIARGELYVWRVGGRPVSMTAFQATAFRNTGGRVNLVYTPPDVRGRGYASACVAALSQRLLSRGWSYCLIFTDVKNPIASKIYRRIGYREVGRYLNLNFLCRRSERRGGLDQQAEGPEADVADDDNS